jgi:hypothetical protein
MLLPVVFLAIASAERSLAPASQPGLVAVLLGLGLTLLAWLAGLPFRPRQADEYAPARLGAITVFLALLAPIPTEMIRQSISGIPAPLEVILVEVLRNLVLALVVMSAWPVCLRLAGFASLFLVLFAISLADDPPGLSLLLACYVLAATWWLVLVYWSMLRQMHPSETATARPPWVSVVAVFGLLGVFLGVGVVGPVQAARRLGEFFSSSGGTGEYHAGARGGVNDGDEEVAGSNAQSAGFVPTDIFIEDDKPSLYDVNNDTYGPPKRNKEQERAMALPADQMIKGPPPAENLRPSRPFSTQREGPSQTRRPWDVGHSALFWVTGRTPLHLRMQTYERFDGTTWYESRSANRALLLAREHDGGTWMELLPLSKEPIWAGVDWHELRIARLKSYTFPTPPHLKGFQLGKINTPEFFGWHQDGILRLRERTIPSNVMLQTESLVPDPAALEDLEMLASHTLPHQLALPELDPRLAALARQWAGETPRGWRQIQQVIARLRNHAEHDRAVTVPDGHPCSASWFLFESRRGPDYLFATAAAVLLRSLNYPTRVASGFYVRPDRYDPERGQTPVEKDDAHFWVEVSNSNTNSWLVIEPTPGYDVLPPPRTWSQWLAASLPLLWGVLGLAALGALAYLLRRPLLDRLGVWMWPGMRQGWRKAVLSTLWLLERRSRWAGVPRPAHCVPSRWQGDATLSRLGYYADWAAYAPVDSPPPSSEAEILATCQASLREWTTRRFRRQRAA